MNQNQEKLKKFANDVIMCNAVKELLFKKFYEPMGVHMNDTMEMHAARSIAIELVGKAWRDIENMKTEQTGEIKINRQIGL